MANPLPKVHFIIRKFEPHNLEQILILFHDTVHTVNIRDYSQEQINTWAPNDADKEQWLQSLMNNISYVAVIDTKIVGFGDATRDGYIDRLYTHAQFQGQGIASALLKTLESDLRKLNVHEFSTEASITARPFFEKHGYHVEKSQEKEHRGVIFHNYVMKKVD